MKIIGILVGFLIGTIAYAQAPKIDVSSNRITTDLEVKYNKIGTITPKDVSRTNNNITLGCETLDRDYTKYESYKEYIVPLGIKKIRLQGGWAKTEKEKGVYDFKWLDDIINDATSRGLTIWLETSYGNPIYVGGGTPFLAGGMPKSYEAKQAWDKWVRALVSRYKGKVGEYEIWNEPDLIKRPVDETIELNVRTAKIIREIDPQAKIAGLALCDLNPIRFEAHIKELHAQGMLEIFDWISYHGYDYRPEDSYTRVDAMVDIMKKYTTKVKLRQGENGAPSKGFAGGALEKHHWTELTQGKWALRRMLNDHGRGIDTSIFCISDMNYAKADSIKIKNVKGLLETDDDKNVVKIKKAYYIVQNLVAVFDIFKNQIDSKNFKLNTQIPYVVFGYKNNASGQNSYVFWFSEVRPTNFNKTTCVDVEISNANIKDPVWVDIVTGGVFEINKDDIKREGDTLFIKQLPLYDAPVVLTDKSLVEFK